MTLDFHAVTSPNAVSSTSSSFVTRNAGQKAEPESPTADRRKSAGRPVGGERRQFGSSHSGLSPAAAELAIAIDQYKLQHRRRYITCEEMLVVINRLGYHKQ